MMNNEKGSSLLIVLLIMTIFTIFGLSLMGLNLNTSKQVSKSGNDLQATNLAEMGAIQLKEEIFRILTNNNGMSVTEIKNALDSQLPTNAKLFQIKQGSTYPYYKIDSFTVTVESEDKVKVDFTSIGYSDSQQQKSITGTIVATKTIVNLFPKIPNDAVKISDDPTYKDPATFTTAVYYDNGFSLQAEKQPLVFLDGLYSTVIVQENKTIVSVTGDAHVIELDLKTNGNEALLCVQGDLYIYGNIPVPIPNPTPIVKSNLNCADEIKTNSKGIYAMDVIYKPLYSKAWDKQTMSVDAKYE